MSATHNGWTNYETWAVKLWLDNDQGSYLHWEEQAREVWRRTKHRRFYSLTRKEQARLELANLLKEEHEEAVPELDGIWADLLNAALSEVNWVEIAGAYLDDMNEEDDEEDEEDEEGEEENEDG